MLKEWPAGTKINQELQYPREFSYHKHIVGVSTIPNKPESYQFIFNDRDRTDALDSAYKRSDWVDFKIPADSIISKVTLMFDKTDCCLYGLKF